MIHVLFHIINFLHDILNVLLKLFSFFETVLWYQLSLLVSNCIKISFLLFRVRTATMIFLNIWWPWRLWYPILIPPMLLLWSSKLHTWWIWWVLLGGDRFAFVSCFGVANWFVEISFDHFLRYFGHLRLILALNIFFGSVFKTFFGPILNFYRVHHMFFISDMSQIANCVQHFFLGLILCFLIVIEGLSRKLIKIILFLFISLSGWNWILYICTKI